VNDYLTKLEELRDKIDDRMQTLALPRYRRTLRSCRSALIADQESTPKALRGHRSIRDTDEQLDAHLAFFSSDGGLARLCRHMEESARGVLRKAHRHVRELERRSARLADLRATIGAVAQLEPEGHPRLGDMVRALVASAHGAFLRHVPREAERLRPPLPRAHRAPSGERTSAPLRPKTASAADVRALRAARDAELRAWLHETVLAGRASVRLSETTISSSDAPRRWLDVARARYLADGRGLVRLGVTIEEADGTAKVGVEMRGVEGPDSIVRDAGATDEKTA
jgi:hypothetical protein